jgi:hypothetical protein
VWRRRITILGAVRSKKKGEGMKVKLIRLVLMSVFVTSGISLAQSQVDERDVASIPFDFYAGGQKLPAGNYTVGIDLEGKVIMLTDDSRKSILLMGLPAGDGSDVSQLVFERLGNTYVLKQVEADIADLSFSTKVGGIQESRLESTQVEVALNR